MKLTNDKKQFKEEKRKMKALKQEMIEIHNRHNAEISGKEEKIRELETNIAEFQKKIASLEEESLYYFSFRFYFIGQFLKLSLVSRLFRVFSCFLI